MQRLVMTWVDRLISLSTLISTVALLGAAGLILADVIARNLFDSPFRGTRDVLQMALVIIIFGALATCDRQGVNITVDIFEKAFPRALNAWLNIVGRVLGAVIFLVVGLKMFENTEISQMLNQSTNILNLPKAWFEFAIAGFSWLIALSMGLRALQGVLAEFRPAPAQPDDGEVLREQ